ncbi:hypothetical protein POJ06DRAFT_297659 [Lipomyces tetrasporus]|uniref:Uncharacterized protein n=1 Tax=Lipomyces tetrasporus TaxID=54092 RepID=A0AAD7QK44_9ASCO|nr:uncharacterized protein POJ06DRAFT_297659 [Lipomyces tetrasporus]KAJ8096676.1 hypothetical protein POJ06DRAFT_297659 [Lipomyces tetrasporus]
MSTAPTSATIPIEEFETKLRETVEARGATYQHDKALILRFEDDASGADQDAYTLSSCMHDVFGIDDVEDFAIDKTSQSPRFDVLERIVAKVRQLLGARSLLIIAYIGHGIIDMESNGLQLLSESGSQKIDWSLIHESILASTDGSLQNLDVLARAVQILAASDRHSKVRSRTDGVSFTQRFRQAAYALKHAGNLSVNVESIFGELQRLKPSKAPDAVYNIIGNAHLLVLPLCHRSSSNPGNLEESSSNETSVLFKISLTGRPSDVILKDFQQLSNTIPPEFKVTVERAYESNSVLLICRASWETFARIRATLDCVFVGAIKGPCLVQDAVPQKSTRSFGDDIQNRQEG